MSDMHASAMVESMANTLLANPQSIAGCAADVVESANIHAINSYLRRDCRKALLGSLHEMLQTVEAVSPDTAKRRTGLIGYLFGRDLQQKEISARRIQDFPLVVRRADEQVQQLLSAEHEGRQLLAKLNAQRGLLSEQTGHMQSVLDSAAFSAHQHAAHADSLRQRLHTLTVLQQSWLLTGKHLELDVQHTRELIERYQHIRDTLIPVWQHYMLSKVKADDAADNQQSALREALATIISELKPTDRET